VRSAAAHLQKARKALVSGAYLLAGGFADEAGRETYMAAFHAALALIVWRTGKEPKTHRDTHTEFAKLARDEAGIDRSLIPFLSRSYNLKSIADYDDGAPVTAAEAQTSLAMAVQFVDAIADIIPPSELA
jgi:uncharacterized protein (UPF0332 family)